MTVGDPEANYGLSPFKLNPDDEFLERRRAALEREYLSLFQAIKMGSILVEKAALEQAEKDLRNEAESGHDGLTGLLNRKGFFELFDVDLLAFRRTIHDAKANEKPTFGCLVLLDLDNFGILNTTKGDAFGDEILQQVAVSLQEEVRPDDLVARFGGEEFVLFLMGAKLEDAGQVVERIRKLIPHQTSSNLGYEQTASFGVVEFPLGLTEEQLSIAQNRESLFKDVYDGVIEAKIEGKRIGKNVTILNRGNGNLDRITPQQ